MSGTTGYNTTEDVGLPCLRNLSDEKAQPDSSHKIVVALFTSLLAVVILIGNGLIIVSVCLVRKLRQPANYLIVSLAFSDFLVALVVLPLTITVDILGEWVFGTTLCNIHVSFDVICCATSILNLVMISIDRYLMITRPMWYPKKRTAKLMGGMILCVWVVACLIIFPALFGFTKNVTGEPGWINLTMLDKFSENVTIERLTNVSIGQKTNTSFERCSSELPWQVILDMKWEHNVSKLTGKSEADYDLIFDVVMIKQNGSDVANFDFQVKPTPSEVKVIQEPARFIRILMNGTQRKHFKKTSLDVYADRIHGKTCLISQDVWFTIYSTISSFYIPLAVMLFMYYKIYLEASRFKARQRARSRSLSDQTHSLFSQPLKRKHNGANITIITDDSSSDMVELYYGMHRPSNDVNNRNNSIKIGEKKIANTIYSVQERDGLDTSEKLTSRDDETCLTASSRDGEIEDKNCCTIDDDEKTKYQEVNGNMTEELTARSKMTSSWCRNLHYSSNSVFHSEGSGSVYIQPSNGKQPRCSKDGCELCYRRDTVLSTSSFQKGRSILSTRRKSSRKPSSIYAAKRRTSFRRRNSSAHRERMRNVKAIRTLGIIVLVFTFCWLPFFVLTFLRPFVCEDPKSSDCLPDWLVRLVLWLGYLNSAMNPFIYIGFSPDLRSTFKFLICCKCTNVDRRLAQIELRQAIEDERKYHRVSQSNF